MLSAVRPVSSSVIATNEAQVSSAHFRNVRAEKRSAPGGAAAAVRAVPTTPAAASPSPPANNPRRDSSNLVDPAALSVIPRR